MAGNRKAAYAREYKKYGIRYAHQPQVGSNLAGVVQVADSRGKGYAHIKFDECFVEAIGKVMPFGVSREHPCYLRVVYAGWRRSWRVYAFYIDSPRGVLLWEAEDRPLWIKRIRRIACNESQDNAL